MLDVIIVGAGAAGLAAGRYLTKKGLSVQIVEAADRVGGRAWTDTRRLGVPLDMGCSWVSGSDQNSLVKVARRNGFTLIDHTDAPDTFLVDGAPAGKADVRLYDKAWRKIKKALDKAGKAARDVPASDVIPQDLPFSGTVQSWLGPMDHGADFKDLSPIDYWDQADDQPSYLVREGFGAVVACLAEGLPITLGTAVTRIDWSGTAVSVETTNGTLRGRTCLVTVSTGVLASGAIRFAPELPVATQEAIHGVPMGLLVKVPLQFSGTRLGFRDNEWVTYAVGDDVPAQACFFIAWPCGHDYMFGNIGGDLGWELSREPAEVTVDFALETLVSLLGTDVRKAFRRGLRTDWANDPLTRGAYSVQRPGCAGARKALGRSVGDRIFFAGEALGGAHAALANGAHDSGRARAKQIRKMLQRKG
ncbi:MAG: NAD(P)/FAD-dependent oxidoreductase [Pseudomonadota bacterium]